MCAIRPGIWIYLLEPDERAPAGGLGPFRLRIEQETVPARSRVMFFSYANWLSLRTRQTNSGRRRRPFPQPYRPHVEWLERRDLLAVLTVMNTKDAGPM